MYPACGHQCPAAALSCEFVVEHKGFHGSGETIWVNEEPVQDRPRASPTKFAWLMDQLAKSQKSYPAPPPPPPPTFSPERAARARERRNKAARDRRIRQHREQERKTHIDKLKWINSLIREPLKRERGRVIREVEATRRRFRASDEAAYQALKERQARLGHYAGWGTAVGVYLSSGQRIIRPHKVPWVDWE
jgi:hypothetical protein